MRFTYVGPEIACAVFGQIFAHGQPVEVSDTHAIAKLTVHPEFTHESSTPVFDAMTDAPKRRGRPPLVKPDADQV